MKTLTALYQNALFEKCDRDAILLHTPSCRAMFPDIACRNRLYHLFPCTHNLSFVHSHRQRRAPLLFYSGPNNPSALSFSAPTVISKVTSLAHDSRMTRVQTGPEACTS
jgi:hypothetical protein